MNDLEQFDLQSWLHDMQLAVEELHKMQLGYSTKDNLVYLEQEVRQPDIEYIPEAMRPFCRHVQRIDLIGVYNGYAIDSISDIRRKTDLEWFPGKIVGGDYQGEIIVFGSTGGGDLFAFHRKRKQVLLLPSYGVTGAQLDGALHEVRLIADDFNHFLIRLLEDLRAFTEHNDQWNYMI